MQEEITLIYKIFLGSIASSQERRQKRCKEHGYSRKMDHLHHVVDGETSPVFEAEGHILADSIWMLEFTGDWPIGHGHHRFGGRSRLCPVLHPPHGNMPLGVGPSFHMSLVGPLLTAQSDAPFGPRDIDRKNRT